MHKDRQLFKLIRRLIFISFLFFISSIQARASLPPRFSANAYTGVYTVGQADLMVSVDGDQQHNLYLDPQGAYGSDQQWYGDLGLGYRWIKNDAAILGAYLFAGRTRVENNSRFWITNPGVEVMGSRWDARINAYIPVAGRSNELGFEEFTSMNTVFTGHTGVINSVFNDVNAIQQIGNGADARVGYQFFHQVPLKGYVGAYFFAIPNTDNVRGGAAGLEYWFNNIRIFANYSYDNYQHSNVVGGLGISFGGVRKHWADPSLSERLTDPVERYLANLGHGSGIPSKKLLYGIGSSSSSTLISNSIAFFSQTGTPNNGGTGLTLANCTFENPCGPTDFSPTAVVDLSTLLPNTVMYFNGGNYTALNTPGTSGILLFPGQSVHSRTADYSQPATGAARSIFNGGFVTQSNNTLENLIIQQNPSSTNNIGVRGSGFDTNVLVSGSQIGTPAHPFSTGVNLTTGTQYTIESSSIFAFGTSPVTTGIQMLGISPSLTMNNSTISVSGATSSNRGIDANAATGAIATINSSNIAVGTSAETVQQVAIFNLNSGTITMNGGTLTLAGTGAGPRLFTSGGPVTLNGVTCVLNGTTVVCP